MAGDLASVNFTSLDIMGCPGCSLEAPVLGPDGSLTVAAPAGTATPEPSAWLMLATALLAISAFGMMQRRRAPRA